MTKDDTEELVTADVLARSSERVAPTNSYKSAPTASFSKISAVRVTQGLNQDDGNVTPEHRDFMLTFPEDNGPHSAETKSDFPFRRMYLAAFAAFMNVVSFGMASSYSAPATEDMKLPNRRIKDISVDQITWIASLLPIGSMFGAASSAYLSQRFGRKAVLICCSLPYTFGWLLVAYAPTIGWIYAGRILTGFCTGLIAAVVPGYVVEISTPEVRGFLGSWFQLSFSTGVLLTMSLGSVTPWSWLAVICAVPVATGLCILYFMPESPHWLISKGQGADAMQAVKYLQGSKFDAVSECVTIYQNQISQPKKGISAREFLEPKIYKPLLLSFGLMFFQQFAGINALMAYTVSIFIEVKSSIEPAHATIIVAAVQVIAAFFSGILMDKSGRRILFTVSGSFLCLGLFFLGLFELLSKRNEISTSVFGWVPILSFVIYVAAYSVGYGPIPWLMIPEMVPMYARSTVMGMSSVFNFMCMFLVTKTFDDLKETIELYGTFWLYASFAALGCLFCWVFLPETKGKPLHEIQGYFSGPKRRIFSESASSTQVSEDAEPHIRSEDAEPHIRSEDAEPRIRSEDAEPHIRSEDAEPNVR